MPALTLTRNVEDGHGLRRLTFAEALPSFTTPGQYVTAHLEGHKPAFFALASVPGAPVELLLKVHGDAAQALAALEAGATVDLSDAMGQGFPLPEGDSKPLVILAAGSGLSAIRSVVEAEIDAGLPRAVTVFYGVYTPGHAAYTDRLEAWAEAGVDVRLVVSEEVPGWEGARGFVQQAAKEAGFVRDDVTVVLCGFPAMVDEAKGLYADAGAPAEALLTNF